MGSGDELAGQGLLGLASAAAAAVLLVAWQLHARRATLEHAVLLCFALGQAYSSATLLVGGLLPLRAVYERPDLLEMMHRSRYLIFDCAALPCVIWVLVLLFFRPLETGQLFGFSAQTLRTCALSVLAVVHLVVSCLAAGDCAKYPFSTENCLGILYWRPARFTPRMRYPWLFVTRSLWVLAAYHCYTKGSLSLLLATAGIRLAFHGHMSQWQHWSWEIFAQPLASAALFTALMWALEVTVRCDWRALSQCVVAWPGGATALFSGMQGGLRF